MIELVQVCFMMVEGERENEERKRRRRRRGEEEKEKKRWQQWRWGGGQGVEGRKSTRRSIDSRRGKAVGRPQREQAVV
ncbi:hypothetical protein BHE74_00058437 [Ensete ventricosum]|nr:hypothetical protein GW17_00032284 [Ensete ventricosum]RWW36529.1 hypothetical protein BHE74_00058437 [Ensete ventricosum]